MQSPEPSFLQKVADSLQSFALDNLWQWLFGFLVATLIARRAYFRGVRGPILYLLLGAALGIGTVVGATALLVWSRYIFYGATGVLLLGALGYGAVRLYKREQARLQGHPKGYFDYRRDLNRASAVNLQATQRLTKETENIGLQTKRLAEQYLDAKTENAQERVANRAASMYRGAAIRYRRYAELQNRGTLQFTEAMSGILSWLEETSNSSQLQEYRTLVETFRTSVVSARDIARTFRQSLNGLPNMSQRMNAARFELAQGIDITLSTMDSALVFGDNVMGRLGG